MRSWWKRKFVEKKQVLLLPTVERRRDRIGYLSAVVVVRNEARYLEEWLTFHHLLGCEHFYVYDNGSIDNTAEVLVPYAREGLVTLTHWPRFDQAMRLQPFALAHAICAYGAAWRWMMFIGPDEFLFPVVGDSLVEVLRGYEDLPGIAVPWRTFGFSGHATPPAGLVLENYVMRSPFSVAPGANKLLQRMKSIVDPCRVKRIKGPHIFGLDGGEWSAYDEKRQRLTPSKLKSQDYASDDILRLNHYVTKSREEFDAKTSRGSVNAPSRSNSSKNEAARRRRVDRRRRFADAIEARPVEDRTIQRFLPRLKSALSDCMRPN